MNKITFVICLTLIPWGFTAAQTADQIISTEKSRSEYGQTTAMEGEVVLGVSNAGLRFEEPEGSYKKVVELWSKAGINFNDLFAQQWAKDQREEISDALRAFLSNSPVFFVAEMNQERLDKLGDEFNLVELGGAEFSTAKEAGKWAGLDYLVQVDVVRGSHGENLVAAKMIDLDTREETTAVTAQKGQVMNPVDLARALAHNVEDIYLAKTPEEKNLIQTLQRVEARAMSVSKDSQWMLKIAGIGYATSTVVGVLSGGFSGWFFGPLFAGPLAYISWKGLDMTKKEYNAALDEYDRLIAEYNSTYGEKYVDYYR